MPKIEDALKREALENLFLGVNLDSLSFEANRESPTAESGAENQPSEVNGARGDVSKRHPAMGLMSDDESDNDAPHTCRTYIRHPA